jgi:phosphoglycerate kinase
MDSGLEGIPFITDLELKDKRVFIRLDLNVPLEGKRITDDNRIQTAIPTIKHVMAAGGKIVLASHLGRPKKEEDRAEFSLEPVAERLRELLNVEILLIDDPSGDGPKGLLQTLRPNQIILLENIRFSPDEEKNGSELASRLASYTDVYINDAFGASHRAHSSIVALPTIVKHKGIGFLMKREIEMLDKVLHAPAHPFVAVLGGAKVSDKIGLIDHLIDRIDVFIIGGAMAYTFLAAKGMSTGNSRVEQDRLRLAQELIQRIEARDKKLILPIDHVVAESLNAPDTARETTDANIREGRMGLDIGPQTRALYRKEILAGKTIFWNGPMGVFEKPPFEKGTFAIAKALADHSEATTIVGGGDSASAMKASGFADRVTHISTGGGASLEYLQGDKLPGLEVLRKKRHS